MNKNLQSFLIKQFAVTAICCVCLSAATQTTINNFPWIEDFEHNGNIPPGWSHEYLNGTTKWSFQSTGYSTTNVQPHSGNYLAYFAKSDYTSITRLVTCPINLSEVTNPILSFYYTTHSWGSSFPDDIDELRVYYRTSSTGTWTLIPTAVYTTEQTTWLKKTLTLPNPSANYYIAFEATSKYGHGICLDDVSIDGKITKTISVDCGTPTYFYDIGGMTGNYAANEDITYIFTGSEPNYPLTMTFTAFETESNYDVMTIYDGGTTSGTILLSEYGGNALPPMITSTGNKLTVVWKSDGSIVKAGWAATVTCSEAVKMSTGTTIVDCGSTCLFYDSGGVNGNYGNNQTMTHTFTSGSNIPLKMSFSNFSTDNADKITIYDGTTTNGTVLLNAFGGTTLPPSVSSTGSSLTVKWVSDNANNASGWTATIVCNENSGGNNVCNGSVIYCSTAGNDNNTGSSTSPVKTLAKALTLAGANNSSNRVHIRMAGGAYIQSTTVNLISNVIIDGGWRENTFTGEWTKDNDCETKLHGTFGTVTSNNATHRIALRSEGKTNWTLQDLTIDVTGYNATANTTNSYNSSSGKGNSVYGVHISGNATGDKINRCTIKTGNGGGGKNGVNGGNGTDGSAGGNGSKGYCYTEGTGKERSHSGTLSSGSGVNYRSSGGVGGSAGRNCGNGAAPGGGGNGGKGGFHWNGVASSYKNYNPNPGAGLSGSMGVGINGGNGGYTGSIKQDEGGYNSANCKGDGVEHLANAPNGNSGSAGTQGVGGLNHAGTQAPTEIDDYGMYFKPNDGKSGGDGNGGSGGGGGGGGGGAIAANLNTTPWTNTWRYASAGGTSGGGGGGGGGSGSGGTGGGGGGSSFGIYTYNATGNTPTITSSCISTGISGKGGNGGNGGIGGNGGKGGSGTIDYAWCLRRSSFNNANEWKARAYSGYGGAGGKGGKGGNGANGQTGAQGASYKVARVAASGLESGETAGYNATPANLIASIDYGRRAKTGCTNSQIATSKNSGSWHTDITNRLINDKTPTTSSYSTSYNDVVVGYPTIGTYNTVVGGSQIFITKERTLGSISTNDATINLCEGGSSQTYTYDGALENGEMLLWELHDASNNPVIQKEEETFSSTQRGFTTPDNLAAGTYYIKLEVSSKCCGMSIPIWKTITVNPTPSVSLSASQVSTECVGTKVHLTASPSGGTPNYNYAWSGGSTSIPNSPIATVTPTESTTYRVSVTDQRGCANSATATVNINDVPFTNAINNAAEPDIREGDYVWAGATNARWGESQNWLKFRSNAPHYSAVSRAPAEGATGNVFIIKYEDCVDSFPVVNVNNGAAKNLTILSGATLKGSIGTLKISGDFVNKGTFDAGTGTIEFNGGNDGNNQAISSVNSLTFNNLTLNQSAASNIIISDGLAVTVNRVAKFTKGILKGNLTFGTGATVAGGNNSSFVDGNVKKLGTGEFTFPTGEEIYAPLKTRLAANTTVRYHRGHNGMPDWWEHSGNMGSGDTKLDHVTDKEHWVVSSTANLTGMTLYWNPTAELHSFNNGDLSYLRIAYADHAVGCYPWTNMGGEIADGSTTGSGSISDSENGTTGVVLFNSGAKAVGEKVVTFASISRDKLPLPVELLTFTAECTGETTAVVAWSTATETDSKRFILEKSDNAVDFFKLAELPAAGNSVEVTNYRHIDDNLFAGNNYYRLTQVDYDGRSTRSEIISVNCQPAPGELTVSVYPNPTTGGVNVVVSNLAEPFTLDLTDGVGKTVYSERYFPTGAEYRLSLDLQGLEPAVYNLRITSAAGVVNKQVVKL